MKKTAGDWTAGFFQDEVGPIVARHMQAADGNPERYAEIMEALVTLLATTVAQACRGDKKAMGQMLEGLTNHLMVVAAERQPMMAFLGQFMKKR